MVHDTQKLLIGAHMSVSGGLENALLDAQSVHANAVQIFTKSNQQWHAKPLTTEQIELFIATKKQTAIHAVNAHACYLINLCSPDLTTRKKSTEALLIELERCAILEIPYLVVHPGACKDLPRAQGLAAVAASINQVMDKFSGKTSLLIENMAGQGSTVGSTIDELAVIYDAIDDKKRVHFCIDTCHAYASGYQLDDKQHYEKFWTEFDEKIGINHVMLFHINNSLKPCGSHVDRHAPIYDGLIKETCFELLINDVRFINAPKILETPKDTGLEEDRKNLKTLVSYVGVKKQTWIQDTPLEYYLKRKAT